MRFNLGWPSGACGPVCGRLAGDPFGRATTVGLSAPRRARGGYATHGWGPRQRAPAAARWARAGINRNAR
eukprot:8750634-Lingulodinium_polyedra.AAC.1